MIQFHNCFHSIENILFLRHIVFPFIANNFPNFRGSPGKASCLCVGELVSDTNKVVKCKQPSNFIRGKSHFTFFLRGNLESLVFVNRIMLDSICSAKGSQWIQSHSLFWHKKLYKIMCVSEVMQRWLQFIGTRTPFKLWNRAAVE